ncbi:hypothetical protein AVEN_218632-1 [Araneus ventricosus]|uniref:Uncharacterized protein n=1 Tax=Araneus ventricosus TaxID=182803 RepID=A0A4Y2SH14_ARAVE|nr:hypothetical protein AVEN_218632-1 [Araneus ventricosus]
MKQCTLGLCRFSMHRKISILRNHRRSNVYIVVFLKHRKFRFTRDDVYDVSRCSVDIDVHTRREEHCSRSHIDDRKCAAFLRIISDYRGVSFFHRDLSSRDVRCEVRIVVLTR